MIEYKIVSWEESGIPIGWFNELGADDWEYVERVDIGGGVANYLFKRTTKQSVIIEGVEPLEFTVTDQTVSVETHTDHDAGPDVYHENPRKDDLDE